MHERSVVRKIQVHGRRRARKAALVDGAWHDDLTMGLLDLEYAQLKSSSGR
jgi:hypothetical protein